MVGSHHHVCMSEVAVLSVTPTGSILLHLPYNIIEVFKYKLNLFRLTDFWSDFAQYSNVFRILYNQINV